MKVVIPDTVREHREAANLAELSEAFAPCDIPSLAKRLWEAYGQQRELGKEIALLKQALTAWCEKTGDVIEVEGQPALRLVETYTDFNAVSGTAQIEWVLRFDDTRRAAWLEKQAISGTGE